MRKELNLAAPCFVPKQRPLPMRKLSADSKSTLTGTALFVCYSLR